MAIGELAGKYALTPDWYAAVRGEYFDDRGGLFSGVTQALKEVTFTLNRQITPGFLLRGEYRRDWSNRPYFLSDAQGAPEGAQSTGTLGLVYWWGTKQGSW